jgi:VWFA-related protein
MRVRNASYPSPCLLLATMLAALALPLSIGAQTTTTPEYTIQTRVPLTIVDVTVADAHGSPVHDLKQSDFTLLEDGHPLTLNSFEEHRNDLPTPALVTTPAQPPDTFTNAPPTPASNHPVNILLLDNLNTPLSNQRILQQRLLTFVDKLPPHTLVAVFSLSEFHLSVLQQFTSDHELLKAAINNPKITGQIPPIEDLWQDQMNLMQETSDPEEEECNHAALRAQDSLAAMKQIARALEGMPGRKNLLWFSGSFPLQMEAHATTCYDVTQDVQAADDLLGRAHVIVYPADPRAMDAMTEQLPHQPAVVRRQSVEHLTQEAIAEQTGGKAFYNNNDLAAFAAEAVNAGANFYTLTYAPTNQTLDTRFRTIAVKVDQPSLHLVYRPGYYAVDPASPLPGKAADTRTPMQSALLPGSLEPTQILFSIHAIQSPATDSTLPPDNSSSKQMKPPYRRITLSYRIDIHGIDFQQSLDNNYRANFEYTAVLYNADSDAVLNTTSKTINPVLPPAVFYSMLQRGANAQQQIDIPATGDYVLRIAVHDLTTDHVGAIEIPTASLASTN